MEDIKKTANEQAAEETKEAVKVVTDSDTPEGAYVHEFTKPYTFEEKTYTKLVFDFEKLIGDDLVAGNTHYPRKFQPHSSTAWQPRQQG